MNIVSVRPYQSYYYQNAVKSNNLNSLNKSVNFNKKSTDILDSMYLQSITKKAQISFNRKQEPAAQENIANYLFEELPWCGTQDLKAYLDQIDLNDNTQRQQFYEALRKPNNRDQTIFGVAAIYDKNFIVLLNKFDSNDDEQMSTLTELLQTKDNNGKTPLHHVANNLINSDEMFEQLFTKYDEHREDFLYLVFDIKDNDGKTVFDIAIDTSKMLGNRLSEKIENFFNLS